MRRSPLLASLLSFLLAVGCQTMPNNNEKDDLEEQSTAAIKKLKNDDIGLERFLSQSYAYVIFPRAGKAGFIFGGSYGRGQVYERGNFVGYADVSQATVGLQAGAQSFSELVAFETKTDFDRFTAGKFAFAANASAVALKTGAADSAKYTDGAAVFVEPIGGLMFEAVIGGQQFTYVPK